MSLTYKIWNFPTFQISKQLFYVPGAAVEGGFTSGGVRMSSPEPGGRSIVELEPSLQTNEWDYPLSSWLMSKTNGELFTFRLAPTPQVASSRVSSIPWGAESIYPDAPWSNLQNWVGDIVATYSAISLEGSNVIYIDMSDIGPLLRHGHVLGHKQNCYVIDDIEYDISGLATITVKPPLRKNVAIGDIALFRPYFTGTISNGDEMKSTYDSTNNGAHKLNRIVLLEAIV